MIQRTFVISGIVLLLGGAAGYFYFYQRPDLGNEEGLNQSGVLPISGGLSDGECGDLSNMIMDGTFDKIEDEFLYFQSKEKEGFIEKVKLSSKIEFIEMFFSGSGELIEQKNISRSDLSQGDPVSIVIIYDQLKPERREALVIRRMIVK